MAKHTGILLEDTDTAVISDVSIPDLTSVGWLSADQVFIQLEGQQTVGEVYFPGTEEVEDTSVIESMAADIPANSLLADIDNYELEDFDLNDLLSQADTSPDRPMKQSLDEPGMKSAVAEAAPEAESSQSDAHCLPVNMGLSQLTIVIDDEADSNTVAI